jgi:prepilin-type N-terminal cleavage/methylation domain-containing protein
MKIFIHYMNLLKRISQNHEKGITLIELLCVIAIISILGAVGMPFYQGYKKDQEIKVVQNCLELIVLAESEYYRSNLGYWILPNTDLHTDLKITPKTNTALFGGAETCPEDWAIGVHNKKHRGPDGEIVNPNGYRAGAYHPTKRLQLWVQDNREKNASCHLAYDGWCNMAPHIGTCPTSCAAPFERPK